MASASPNTQAAYLKTARRLAARYARESGETVDTGEGEAKESSPMSLARWAAGVLRPTVRPASWRQYKASLACLLRERALELGGELEGENGGQCKAAAAAAEWLAAQGSEGCLPRIGGDRRTSQLKLKRLPPEDLVEACGWLRSCGGKWGPLAAAWLHAGVLTGLRPVEWREAKVIENLNFPDGAAGNLSLVVRNGKYAANNGRGCSEAGRGGRACGEHRTLGLSGLSKDGVAVVAALCRMLAGESHAAAYKGCRTAVREANTALWPGRDRHVTLYSARHQFAADAKASGMGLAEVAACMGHLDTDTATQTYGRRASGRSPVRVTPAPENVEIVERHAAACSETGRSEAKTVSIDVGQTHLDVGPASPNEADAELSSRHESHQSHMGG